MSAAPDTPEQLLQLYPYQQRYLHDEARLAIAMFARQTGKTFTSCAAITRDVALAEAAGRRTRWVILSRGERQAKEAMLEHIQPQTRALMRLYQGLGQPAEPEEVEVRDEVDPRIVYRGLETEWPMGSRVTALPANPSTARGFSANVLLDEFAFHQDSSAIWRALYPGISKPGLRLRVVSTPNGKQNMFYRLWHAGEPWSHHHCTLGEAIAQGLDRDEDELRRGAADDLLCRQEFDLEFLDEAGQWLSLEDLAACENELAGQPEHYAGGSTWIGVDIARRRDLYVVVALEQVGPDLWLREIEAHRDMPFGRAGPHPGPHGGALQARAHRDGSDRHGRALRRGGAAAPRRAARRGRAAHLAPPPRRRHRAAPGRAGPRAENPARPAPARRPVRDQGPELRHRRNPG